MASFLFLKSRTGQGSPEFSVVTGFVLLLFVILIFIVIQKQSEAHELQVFIDAKKVASTVADNIDMLSQNGHGYYRYFSIPNKLFANTDYNLTVANNYLEITYEDKIYSIQVIAGDVQMINLSKGEHRTNCAINRQGSIILNSTCNLR